jgi:hypothetical protein
MWWWCETEVITEKFQKKCRLTWQLFSLVSQRFFGTACQVILGLPCSKYYIWQTSLKCTFWQCQLYIYIYVATLTLNEGILQLGVHTFQMISLQFYIPQPLCTCAGPANPFQTNLMSKTSTCWYLSASSHGVVTQIITIQTVPIFTMD